MIYFEYGLYLTCGLITLWGLADYLVTRGRLRRDTDRLEREARLKGIR